MPQAATFTRSSSELGTGTGRSVISSFLYWERSRALMAVDRRNHHTTLWVIPRLGARTVALTCGMVGMGGRIVGILGERFIYSEPPVDAESGQILQNAR